MNTVAEALAPNRTPELEGRFSTSCHSAIRCITPCQGQPRPPALYSLLALRRAPAIRADIFPCELGFTTLRANTQKCSTACLRNVSEIFKVDEKASSKASFLDVGCYYVDLSRGLWGVVWYRNEPRRFWMQSFMQFFTVLATEFSCPPACLAWPINRMK